MISKLKYIAKSNGYIIYDDPYKLNIWGVRSPSTTPNSFDDEIHVFYTGIVNRKKKWEHHIFKCTTDPGTYWLENPMNPQGTALLATGQYIDTYKIAKHRNKYYALCQRLKKVTVIRDYNRNAILDFYNGKTQTGMFGINIHRARKTGDTFQVDSHSAGCQVFQNASDFEYFMRLCEIHKKIHGNVFTYTLIDKRQEQRVFRKKLAIATLGLGLLFGAIWNLTKDQTPEPLI